MTVPPPRGRSAKYTVPTRPADLLHRARLVDFIHDHIYLKLILISASPGYGKTSLASDFAHDTDYPIAWCRFDESDTDIATMVGDVSASLSQAFPAFKSTVP